MFLTEDDMVKLTGRKIRRLQIEALRVMGVAFHINAVGRPVVARSTIEGRPGSAAETQPARSWRSNALNTQGAQHGKKTNRQPQPARGHARPA